MNKAEEQYLYQMGWQAEKHDILFWGNHYKGLLNFASELLKYAHEKIDNLPDRDRYNDGKFDYLSSIIHSIHGNVITDWPSFVEHMTGETYE